MNEYIGHRGRHFELSDPPNYQLKISLICVFQQYSRLPNLQFGIIFIHSSFHLNYLVTPDPLKPFWLRSMAGINFCHYYLRQGDTVLPAFVCLWTTFRRKLWTDYDEIFWKYRGRSKEESIRFWKLSVERRPPPTFKGKVTPDILMTTDHIFMKILPEMHQGTRKSPLPF